MVRDKKLKAKSKLLGFSDRSFINTSEEENKLASNNQQDITAACVRAYFLVNSFFNNRTELRLLFSTSKLFLVQHCCQVYKHIYPKGQNARRYEGQIWFFSIQLLKKHTLNPEITLLNQLPTQKALFKVPKICNINFWIENDPPPLWPFSENSSDLKAPH